MSSSNDSGNKAVEAHVVDVVQRKAGLLKPKQYAYVVDVTWSDGSHTHIWRSYQEFFHFQCNLLAAFPEEASEKNPESRTIPFLPGKQLFSRSNKKLAEKRREGINDYVQALLRLTSNIVDSDLVRQFFSHRTTDPVGLDTGQEDGTLHTAGAVAAVSAGQVDNVDQDVDQELEERETEEMRAEEGNSMLAETNVVPAGVEAAVSDDQSRSCSDDSKRDDTEQTASLASNGKAANDLTQENDKVEGKEMLDSETQEAAG